MRSRRIPSCILVGLTLVATACTSTGSNGPAGTPAPAGTTLSNSEIEAIYRARMEASRTRFVQADVDFMTGMIHHHAQAVEMARLAPRNEAGHDVQTLAARILITQQDEIALMQRWLEDRNQPVPVLHVTEQGVTVHVDDVHGAAHGAHGHPDDGAGHGDHSRMPGMLTADQLAALAETRDGAFDRLFLTLMIEHHLGAVTMVHDLFATDGAAQDDVVFRLASDVQVDQLTEVARMQRMLERLPSGDGRP